MCRHWKPIVMPGVCALILGCTIVSFDAAARQARYEAAIGPLDTAESGAAILSRSGSGFEPGASSTPRSSR